MSWTKGKSWNGDDCCEINKISEELEAAHRRIKTQNMILERTVTIHERLTQCILKGKGVEEITTSLAELMKCTVILEDLHLVPQSICCPDQPGTRDVLTPYLPITTSPTFNKGSASYLRQKRPFLIADQYSDIQVFRLVSPILVGSELLGFVSLLENFQTSLTPVSQSYAATANFLSAPRP